MQAADLKGLVLSGGRGSRLRPLTFTRAKQLIPVGNKPILFYVLEDIARTGIHDVGIVVGDTRDEVIAAVGTGDRWGLRVTYIEQPEPLGLAHAVKVARDFLGDHPFLMYLGDNLLKQGVRQMVDKYLATRPNCYILLAEVPDPQRFGIAVVQGDRVISLEEKPRHPRSNLALVGVYIFDATIHEAIDQLQPSWRGEYEITEAIQYQIDHGRTVHFDRVTGWWKDTGQPADLLEANRLVLEELTTDIQGELEATTVEGRVAVGPRTRIVRSHLRGPLIIGADCQIESAYIGPFTSIHDEVTITHSEIEYSIVLRGARIEHISRRIESSILGCNVYVTRADRRPQAVRFTLGDQSRVELP